MATLEFNRKYIFALIAEGTIKKKRREEWRSSFKIATKKQRK